jgi:hypothetical protein
MMLMPPKKKPANVNPKMTVEIQKFTVGGDTPELGKSVGKVSVNFQNMDTHDALTAIAFIMSSMAKGAGIPAASFYIALGDLIAKSEAGAAQFLGHTKEKLK